MKRYKIKIEPEAVHIGVDQVKNQEDKLVENSFPLHSKSVFVRRISAMPISRISVEARPNKTQSREQSLK